MTTPKAILICARLCSGKTTLAQKLCKQHNALLLSVDEVMLSLFRDSGDSHDLHTTQVKQLLYNKSLEILSLGVSVVLDWGFWQRAERSYAKRFYKQHGFDHELHYIDISDKEWHRRIQQRNSSVSDGNTDAYYVDDGLFQKAQRLFEMPNKTEINVIHK